MALSAGAAGAGGAGMVMAPGVAFGGNAMANPANFKPFEPPPTASCAGGSCCPPGKGDGGGAYDLRGWEKEEEPNEDMHACLGVDVGTSSVKVSVSRGSMCGNSRASIRRTVPKKGGHRKHAHVSPEHWRVLRALSIRWLRFERHVCGLLMDFETRRS